LSCDRRDACLSGALSFEYTTSRIGSTMKNARRAMARLAFPGIRRSNLVGATEPIAANGLQQTDYKE
jgi:hypothetical protein